MYREETGHEVALPEMVGPTRVVRIGDDRQRIWMECNNEDWGVEPFECKIEIVDSKTEGSTEVATFTCDRDDVYLEYNAGSIEDEYLWGETYCSVQMSCSLGFTCGARYGRACLSCSQVGH